MRSFVKKFSAERIKSVKIGRDFYIVNDELEGVRKRIQGRPESFGVFLGSDKAGKNAPSLALLEMLSKLSDRKVAFFVRKGHL